MKKSKRITTPFALLLAVLAILASTGGNYAGGATVTWTGDSASTSNWSDADNWAGMDLPNNGDDVNFVGNFKMQPQDDIASLSLTQLVFPANAFRDFIILVNPNIDLTFGGIGTQNNSSFAQAFRMIGTGNANTGGFLNFVNDSSAGNVSFLTDGATSSMGSPGLLQFDNSATAGTANITNRAGTMNGAHGGLTRFDDDSGAGTAMITNQGGTADGSFGGSAEFYMDTTAAGSTIVNNGAAVTGARGGFALFVQNSTAGTAMISNNAGTNGGDGGATNFNTQAKGGSATIINFGSAGTLITTAGSTDFTDSADAQMAIIENRSATATNGHGGFTIFQQSATAGSSTITNSGGSFSGPDGAGSLFFEAGPASAGTSTITNDGGTVAGAVGGSTTFFDNSTASSAMLTNNGSLFNGGAGLTKFLDTSTAGAATLTANGGNSGGPGGRIQFFNNSTGGTSRVRVNGNGLLDISSHNALGVTIGSLEGGGDVFLGGNNLTVGTNNMSTTFSGFMQDGDPMGGGSTGGSLTKVGTGTLVFSGTGIYTGVTNIDAGILQLDGSITSTTFVNPGGTLSGSGTIMSASLNNNGGTVSPGTSPGTLTVGGGYGQSSSGTLRIEIGGLALAQHDLLSVGTSASLSGTLQLVRINNFLPANGDSVTILTTVGTVTGPFTTVTDNFPGLIQPQVVYDPDAVRIVFAVGSFTGINDLTPNQQAVAENLDAVMNDPRAMALIDFLGNELPGNLPHDYDLIAPEELASIYEIGFSQAMVQNNNLMRRMDDIRAGSNGFCANGFAPRTVDSGYNKESDGTVVLPERSSAPAFVPCPENRWGIFATGTGDFVEVSNNDFNAHGYDITTGNFTVGADYRFGEHFAVGIDGGYSGSRAELVDHGRIDVDGGKIGAYATAYGKGWFGSKIHVDLAGSGGWNNYDTHRTGLQDELVRGSTDGGEFNLLLAYGGDWTFGCFNIGTWSSLQYSQVHIDGFTEEGSLAPLEIQDQDQNSFRATTGIRASYDFKFGKCGIVRPEVRAAWQHEYEDRAYAIDARLASGAGDVFRVHGPKVGRDAALVGAGVNVQWSPRFSTGIYYDGVLGRSNYTNNAVTGGFSVSF